MNILSRVLVTLVLGSSSAALAQPAQIYGDSAPTYRHPGDGWNRRPSLPTFLGSGQLTAYGRSRIAVSSPMRFQKLQLAATSGALFVDKITIVFADGDRQVVNLDTRLGRGSAPVTIDLEGRRARQIASVRVSGRGGYRSMFSITGV